MVLVDAISERVEALMRPRQWAVYDARLLTAPPPELAGYGDLETIDFDRSFAQMRRAMAATPLRPMPLVVLSKGEPFDLSSFPDLPPALPAAVERAWRGGQAYLARLLPGARRFTVGDSSHYIQLERPDLVVTAIRGVVEAARERR
jgi:pimeloyl-ACP methyl ester carboxylesterase